VVRPILLGFDGHCFDCLSKVTKVIVTLQSVAADPLAAVTLFI